MILPIGQSSQQWVQKLLWQSRLRPTLKENTIDECQFWCPCNHSVLTCCFKIHGTIFIEPVILAILTLLPIYMTISIFGQHTKVTISFNLLLFFLNFLPPKAMLTIDCKFVPLLFLLNCCYKWPYKWLNCCYKWPFFLTKLLL